MWPNCSTVILMLRKDGVKAQLAVPGGTLSGRKEMNKMLSPTCCGSINRARAEASVTPVLAVDSWPVPVGHLYMTHLSLV